MPTSRRAGRLAAAVLATAVGWVPLASAYRHTKAKSVKVFGREPLTTIDGENGPLRLPFTSHLVVAKDPEHGLVVGTHQDPRSWIKIPIPDGELKGRRVQDYLFSVSHYTRGHSTAGQFGFRTYPEHVMSSYLLLGKDVYRFIYFRRHLLDMIGQGPTTMNGTLAKLGSFAERPDKLAFEERDGKLFVLGKRRGAELPERFETPSSSDSAHLHGPERPLPFEVVRETREARPRADREFERIAKAQAESIRIRNLDNEVEAWKPIDAAPRDRLAIRGLRTIIQHYDSHGRLLDGQGEEHAGPMVMEMAANSPRAAVYTHKLKLGSSLALTGTQPEIERLLHALWALRDHKVTVTTRHYPGRPVASLDEVMNVTITVDGSAPLKMRDFLKDPLKRHPKRFWEPRLHAVTDAMLAKLPPPVRRNLSIVGHYVETLQGVTLNHGPAFLLGRPDASGRALVLSDARKQPIADQRTREHPDTIRFGDARPDQVEARVLRSLVNAPELGYSLLEVQLPPGTTLEPPRLAAAVPGPHEPVYSATFTVLDQRNDGKRAGAVAGRAANQIKAQSSRDWVKVVTTGRTHERGLLGYPEKASPLKVFVTELASDMVSGGPIFSGTTHELVGINWFAARTLVGGEFLPRPSPVVIPIGTILEDIARRAPEWDGPTKKILAEVRGR